MGKKMRSKKLQTLGIEAYVNGGKQNSQAALLQTVEKCKSELYYSGHVSLFMVHDPDINTSTGPGALSYCALAQKLEGGKMKTKDQVSSTRDGKRGKGATPLRLELTKIMCTLAMVSPTSFWMASLKTSRRRSRTWSSSASTRGSVYSTGGSITS